MASKVIKTDLPFTVFAKEADTDYLLARHTSSLGSGFHARAGFFAQQACEKYLKSLMVQNSGAYAPVHKLAELAKHCEQYDAYFGQVETNRLLKQFDAFDQVGRYGGAANFDPLASSGPAFETAGVMVWSDTHLDDLDGFVYKTRSLLDFAKAGFDDSLASILRNNRKSLLVDTWRGRPPLRVVLTKNNRYFRDRS